MDLPRIFYYLLVMADSVRSGAVASWNWLITPISFNVFGSGVAVAPIAIIGGASFLGIIAGIIIKRIFF
jgi:hypothetical protein